MLGTGNLVLFKDLRKPEEVYHPGYVPTQEYNRIEHGAAVHTVRTFAQECEWEVLRQRLAVTDTRRVMFGAWAVRIPGLPAPPKLEWVFGLTNSHDTRHTPCRYYVGLTCATNFDFVVVPTGWDRGDAAAVDRVAQLREMLGTVPNIALGLRGVVKRARMTEATVAEFWEAVGEAAIANHIPWGLLAGTVNDFKERDNMTRWGMLESFGRAMMHRSFTTAWESANRFWHQTDRANKREVA